MTERLLPWLRAAFLGAVGVFAWLGLRGRFDEVASALGNTSPLGVLGGLVLVLLGLLATGLLWLRLMDCVGARVPGRDGFATFFVGQLGKYIPGSVWSIGAQAQMAGRHAVPPRATVAAGLVFLGYHVATGVVLGAAVVVSGALDAPWPTWLTVAAAAGALLGVAPPVVERVARRLAPGDAHLTVADTVLVLTLMTVAWLAYAGALVLLAPGQPWHHLAAFGGAYAIAYAAGVVILVAPAGVGARETVFVLLLGPVVGIAPATALALLARVVHSIGDGVLALATWMRASAHRGDAVQSRQTLR